MQILKLLVPFAHIFGSIVSLVFLSNLLSLGVFGTSSLPGVLPIALLLASLAWLFYLVLVASISDCISLSEPGILLMMFVGVIAGATASVFAVGSCQEASCSLASGQPPPMPLSVRY